MASFGFGYGFSRRRAFQVNGVTVDEAVSDKGVTFTFSESRPIGQYANGDWWVLGPVSITSISPASTVVSGNFSDGSSYAGRAVHGTVVNPGHRSFAVGGLTANNAGSPGVPPSGGTIRATDQQGFDGLTGSVGYAASYNESYNVDPGRTGVPLVVTTGSVVKCLSDTEQATTSPAGRAAPLRFVVLTVVDSIPATDAIRPGVSRASKTSLVRASDFDLSVFQDLAPVNGTPTYAEALSYVSGTFNASQPSSIESANIMPKTHPEYGREVANRIHAALLCLHLSSFTAEQKRTLLLHLATLADDVVSRAEEGGLGYAAGGGNQWKKPALVVATAALGENAPASWVEYCNAALHSNAWAEDSHHTPVTENDLVTPRLTADGRPRTPFAFMALGAVDFGNWGSVNRSDAGMNWDLFYRDVLGGSLWPGIQAVELTSGARALWNNPGVFRYMRTVWHRRNNPLWDGTNRIQPFPLAFSNAYRVADTGTPQIVAAQVKDGAWFIRFDKPIDEVVPAPAAGDFTINVNGSPVAVAAVQVYRTNVGGTLATPVANGNDVVTISYTPGASPLRSVDAVNVPAFTGTAMTNRTDKIGGPNAAYPVVRFAPGTIRALGGTNRLHTANTQAMTGALLKFKINAAPAANSIIFGGTSGAVALAIQLNPDRTLEIRHQSSAASQVLRFRLPALTIGVEYDILWSADMTQANAAAGVNYYLNGAVPSVTNLLFTSGGTIGWNVSNSLRWNHSNTGDFAFGAFWLDPTARLDLTNAANRAKFTSLTSGNLDILTRGDGITGSIPTQFHVGNADQWNDANGMNRGSGNKFFVTSGLVTQVSGGEWV